MKKAVALREAFGKALVKIGKDNNQVVVLDADLAGPTRSIYFKEAYPERFYELGIAEQNMIGVAAGMATCGLIPFVTSFGVFSTKRVLDQLSISVAYPNLNVKVIGAYSGITVGKIGPTHQAIEDVAVMRSIPNFIVLEPADALETEQMIKCIAEYLGPVYMRISREEVCQVNPKDYRFTIGKGVVLHDGADVTLIAAGIMVEKTLEAANILKTKNISARVINMSTIKPIDNELVEKAATETRAIVTVENHSIIGGLGSAVAEMLSERTPTLIRRVGLRDCFAESGSTKDLLDKYEMNVKDIVQAAEEVLLSKKQQTNA